MSDLDELAAVTRQTRLPPHCSIVMVGSHPLPIASVCSIQAITQIKALPGSLIGLALFLLAGATAAAILSSSSTDHHAGIVYGVLAVVGLGWAVLPGGKRYGWQINRFHEGPIAVYFPTPHQATKYREYLVDAMPGVPFAPGQPEYVWRMWVWFRI